VADDPVLPARRRLGRRRPIEQDAPNGAFPAELRDDLEPDLEPAFASTSAASYAAAEVDAAAEAAVIEAAIDATVDAPAPQQDEIEPPLRRRLGRRSAIASSQMAGVVAAADDPTAGRPAHPVDAGQPIPAWLPMLDDRSPNAAICPFLRAVDDQGITGPPTEVPDPSNRCAALREPVPQSLRQQELVCLTAGHVNCPRYLRGAVAASEVATPAARAGRAVTPAVLASIAVLALAFTASIAFIVSRGSLDLTAAVTPRPSASVVAAVPTTEGTLAPTIAPTTAPTPAATSAPTPSPAPTSSPAPTPTPTPTPTPEPTVTPGPTSDRYALLKPCPDTPKCWIYTVRRGDNLFSIANYFGVSLQSIYDRNPWARTQSLRAGRELRLPPPTR